MQRKTHRPQSGFTQDSLGRVNVQPAIFDDSKCDLWIDDKPVLMEIESNLAMHIASQVRRSLMQTGRLPRRFAGVR